MPKIQKDQHTILIVEDEEPLRKVIAEKLHDEGYKTLEAGTGEDCLEILENNIPSLIILDLILPVQTSGHDILYTLSSKETLSDIPVIVLSNKGDFGNKAKIFRYGYQFYMVKAETHLKDLVAKVNEVIEQVVKLSQLEEKK